MFTLTRLEHIKGIQELIKKIVLMTQFILS